MKQMAAFVFSAMVLLFVAYQALSAWDTYYNTISVWRYNVWMEEVSGKSALLAENAELGVMFEYSLGVLAILMPIGGLAVVASSFTTLAFKGR